MKKLDFGQTLQLLGNAGVIIGIFLLVYELNQNRDMMQAQTRTALAEGLADHFYRISTDEGIADISYRGDAGELLTDPERVRYRRLAMAQFSYQENVHYQYRKGLYDEAEFEAQRVRWRHGVYGVKGLKAKKLHGFCCRATHNLWVLLEENRWLEQQLTAGTYLQNYAARVNNSTYKPIIDQLLQSLE